MVRLTNAVLLGERGRGLRGTTLHHLLNAIVKSSVVAILKRKEREREREREKLVKMNKTESDIDLLAMKLA